MPALSEFSLDGKAAIVTGAGQGIGRGIAMALAEAGADIVLAGINVADRSRSMADLEEVASEIRGLGRKAVPAVVDARLDEDVQTMIQTALSELGGRLDIMVNNAGGSFYARFPDINERGFDAVIRNNLKTTFLCCQTAGAVMREQQSGVIINLSSGAAFGGSVTQPVYAATKAGITNLTQTLAIEFAPHVRINAIAPGLTDTIGMRAGYGDQADERVAAQSRTFAAQRLATPRDMGMAAVFLASDAASYVSGITLQVNGGGRAFEA